MSETEIPVGVALAVDSHEAIDAARAAHALMMARTEIALDDTQAYVAVIEDLKKMAGHKKRVDERFAIEKKPWLDGGRAVDQLFRSPREFCEDAIAHLKRLKENYDERVEQRQRELQRKAEEEARRQREAEQREAAKLEEQARREREKREEQARRLEERGRAAQAEAKRQAAEEAEAQKLREAEELRQAAAMAPPPVVHTEAPKVAGIGSGKTYDFVIEDASKLPREYLIPDEKAIRQVVKGLKERTNIPGVRVFEVRRTSVRG